MHECQNDSEFVYLFLENLFSFEFCFGLRNSCEMENKNSIESQTDILSSTFENIKQKNLDEIRLKLNQICRTCLCETNTNIELSAHIDIKGKTMVLLEMLNSFANIKVILFIFILIVQFRFNTIHNFSLVFNKR